MTAFTWTPDKGYERQIKANIRTTQFGDGYEQRQSQGINSVKEDLRLSFTSRPMAEITEIDSFLRTMAGVGSFTWTDPSGQTRKYTCREWTISETTGVYSSLSATFLQVFEA